MGGKRPRRSHLLVMRITNVTAGGAVVTALMGFGAQGALASAGGGTSSYHSSSSSSSHYGGSSYSGSSYSSGYHHYGSSGSGGHLPAPAAIAIIVIVLLGAAIRWYMRHERSVENFVVNPRGDHPDRSAFENSVDGTYHGSDLGSDWRSGDEASPTRPGGIQNVTGTAARINADRKVTAREQEVERAAPVAAEDDPVFAADAVRASATELFRAVQAAWSENDVQTLQGLVGDDLLAEWRLRLEDFQRKGWRNRVELLSAPTVRYVGLVNRAGTERDRVTVRIDARLRDYVIDSGGSRLGRDDAHSEQVTNREYWTLGRRGEGWILESVEQIAEGAHILSDEILAEDTDGDELRDESMIEGAVQDAVPDGVRIAEVADLDFDGTARAAANDLSLADGRFAPQILGIAARRAVAAWAEAIDGDDAALEGIADPIARQALLHAGPNRRIVVRGPRIEKIEITALDAAAEPPTMSLEVHVHGARYIQDRATAAIVDGDPTRAVDFTEHWTLRLDGQKSQPWRLVGVGHPAAR